MSLNKNWFNRFGMGMFAGAVMWVINEAFGNEECRMKKQCSAAEGKANEEYGCAMKESEREFTRINRELSIDSGAHQAKASNRELKEIGPQADGDEWSDTAKLMSTNKISNERIISKNGQTLASA